MVETDWIWRERRLPALSADERVEAARALAVYDAAPRGSSPARIAKFVGTAAVAYPNGKLSDREADTRLKLYQHNLADIDDEILAQAFGIAMRECTFFPTIAEVRRFAGRVPAPRWRLMQRRLRELLDHQPAAEIPAEQLVDPAALAALVRRLGGSLAA